MGGADSSTNRDRRRSLVWWLAVLAAVLAGLVARTWNLDWDDRQHLHPDERHWSLVASSLEAGDPAESYPTVFGPALTWLDGQRSPANPYRDDVGSFVYGPITLAVTRSVAGWMHDGATDGAQPARAVVDAFDTLGVPLLDDSGQPRFDTSYQIDLVGRLVGALIDSLTIVVVALAGRRAGGRLGRGAGLAAAWFYALAVLSVQHAHFFGSEPALALTSALCVLAMLHVDRGGSWRRAAITGSLAGASAGAVMAVKFTGLGLAAVPFALLALLLVRHRRRVDVVRLGAAALGGLVVFRVLCPPAFVGLGLRPNPVFWDDLRASRLAARSDFPPSIQWANRTFAVEPTWWLLKYTLGPGMMIAGAVGLVLLWRSRSELGRWTPAVVVAATLAPYGFVFRDSVTSGRYFVPMVPALAIAAGYAVARSLVWAGAQQTRARRAATVCVTAVIVVTVLWPVAFLNGVHGGDHTRVRASRWIEANVEQGATLSTEAWDDSLPLAVDAVDPSRFEFVTLDLFGVDSVAKVATIAGQLPQVDYIVESSPRVWNSVVRIPARYPSTITLFDRLDDGSLGFERVATFTSPPALGALRLEGGEEAFSVYDHPEVRVWRNTANLDERTIFDLLDPVAAANALAVHPRDAHANGGMATDAERAANQRRPTFDAEIASSGLFANQVVQLVLWLLILVVLAAATWTLLLPVTQRLPDAGVGIAATLAIVVMVSASVVADGWLGMPYGRSFLIGLASVWTIGGATLGWRRRHHLASIVSQRRITIAGAIWVSVAGFGLGAAARAANPDLWHRYRGGEKTFEVAMLTAALRSRSIPPPDSWFAGGALNYHYGGSLMIGVPARLARTTPELALNLGIAMVTMLAAGAAYTAGALLATARRADPEPPDVEPDWRTKRRHTLARRGGLLAAAFVVLVPNLAIVPSVLRRLVGREQGPLDWWGLSRVVPNSPIVTEFPAWSVLFGDLHAHLIGVSIVLTSTTLAVLLLQRSTTHTGVVPTALLLGVVVGMSRAVNSWDFPLTVVAALVVLALVAVATSWRLAVRSVAAVGVGCVAVWLPYTSRVEVGSVGFDLNDSPTPIGSAATHWGLWFLATVVALAAAAPRVMKSRPLRQSERWAAGGVAATVVGAALAGWGAVALATLLAAGCAAMATLAWRCRSDVVPSIAFGVLWLGWTVVAAVEIVVYSDDLDRMNTVFKWWFHAWSLLAVGCAGTIAGLVPRWRQLPTTGRAGRSALVVLGVAVLTTSAFAVLAVPARLDDRTSTGGPSLDGLDWLEAGIVESRGDDVELIPGDDRALIAWLRHNVAGMPTILEAPGEQYDWVGRVSALTGLPTVVGWPYHLSQQRPSAGAALGERISDASAFYRAADPNVRLDVLWRRGVDLVVFGSSERVLAGDDGADEIRGLPCVDVVFDDQTTLIAEVDHACLAPRAAAWSLARGGLPTDVVIVE